jgi:type IX secretion system PorP/SprF family membrane protein
MKRIFLYAIACFAPVTELSSQDIHWSQPSAGLLVQNPAFTGIQNKFTVGVNYRNQWNALGTPYSSMQLAGDYRFGEENPKKAVFSTGGVFSNDVAGEGRYRTTISGFGFSCLVKASDQLRMGAGLGVNMVQHVVNLSKFSWGSQFNGLNYDPSINSGEMAGTVSAWYADINAGVSMIYSKNSGTLSSNDNTVLIAGYGVSHLNRAEIGMNGGSDRLNMKHTLFMTGLVGLENKNVSLKPTAFWYRQGKLNEIMAGMLIRFSIGESSKITGFKKGSAFCAGAFYRVNDAIIPAVQFEKGNFVFGMSYDINVSGLTPASRLRGGVEFSICFIPTREFLYRNRDKENDTD